MSNELSNKAMLVSLKISQWSGRKYDKNISNKINVDYNTKVNAGNYNKCTISINALKSIQKIANEARNFHYQNTLLWNSDGQNILPAAMYFEYTQKISDFKNKFEIEVNNFISEYPTLVANAQNDLGAMYNPQDYPQVSDIKRKFNISIDISPLPLATDFRVNLNQSEIEQIKQDIEARFNDSAKKAMSELWQRVFDVVNHLAEKMNDKEAIFRDSIIDNVIALCQLLPKLNITNDNNLEQMRQDIEAKICSFEPQVLREDSKQREQAAIVANDILSTMAGYMGNIAA